MNGGNDNVLKLTVPLLLVTCPFARNSPEYVPSLHLFLQHSYPYFPTIASAIKGARPRSCSFGASQVLQM